MAGAGNPNVNVFDRSAQGMQAAGQATMGAMAGPQIGAFMNPYTQAVTNQTMLDLERQRQMAGNTMAAQAGAAGAFGGSRHGVADALTNEGFARQGAQTFAGLNQQGFNTALGAAQNQQGLMMQGGAQMGNLAGNAFNMGRQITADQAAQGAQQQALNQAVMDQAAGMFDQYTGQGMNRATNLAGILGMMQPGQTTTESSQPGLLQLLTAAL